MSVGGWGIDVQQFDLHPRTFVVEIWGKPNSSIAQFLVEGEGERERERRELGWGIVQLLQVTSELFKGNCKFAGVRARSDALGWAK